MRDNISPEEKLLRLIRGPKKKESLQPQNPVDSAVGPKTSLAQQQQVLQKLTSFLNIRKIIAAAFILSSIYLILSFVYPFIAAKKEILPKIVPGKEEEARVETKEEIKPVDYYLEGAQRQIFSSPTAAQEAGQPPTAATADLVKDITLIGIISGETPQAIIEDKKTQKTLYVTKGQFIGELQVEDIQEGKVILNYKGQKFELYL